MLIGPNGEPPVLVSVTEIGPPVLPMSTLPKSTVLVSMAMSVSTAPADVGTRATAVAASPTRATAATIRRGACCMGGVLPSPPDPATDLGPRPATQSGHPRSRYRERG